MSKNNHPQYNKKLYNSRLYKIWANMKTRCNNSKTEDYKRYGGRGITYCEKWETFAGFLDDMKEGYAEHLTLDRVDNNGPYTKENCKWSTIKEQARNRRDVPLFEFKGKEKTLAEWSEIIGIKSSTIRQRYYVYGWSLEKTLSV